MVDLLKTTEGLVCDIRPKVAFLERLSTATKLILAKTAFPDKSQFPGRAKSADLPQKHVEQRAAASAESANE